MSFRDLLPVEKLAGLRPKTWVAVGPGFSREEIKEAVLSQGRALGGDAVTSLLSIAQKIVSASVGLDVSKRVLSTAARQETLQLLLSRRQVSKHFPELRQLRKQSGFFRKLDRAIQAGRMACAHFDEDEVLAERLRQRYGTEGYRIVRDEVRVLGHSYERWLDGMKLWDDPAVFARAISILGEQGWPKAAGELPEEILVFSAVTPEGLERAFCEELSRFVSLKRVGPLEAAVGPAATESEWAWQRWHTADDASDALAEKLSREKTLEDHVVLIPDQSGVRRSLRRALAKRGIPLADPRDPHRLKWEEPIKWAFLPLEMVAGDFEREKVIAWIQVWCTAEPNQTEWINEILSRGVRQGLKSYEGGRLILLHQKLTDLAARMGGSGHRKTVRELATEHLALLKSGGAEAWVNRFFEQVWKLFETESEWLGDDTRRLRGRLWWDRFRARVEEAPAPAEPLHAVGGVHVFRLQQAPLANIKKVWILGLPPDWLSGGEGSVGDYWFSARERETLRAEFAIRGARDLRRERIGALSAWIAGAEKVCLLDSQYESDGRERPALTPTLRDLARELGNPPSLLALLEKDAEQFDHGAYESRIPSYGAIRPVPPQRVELAALPRRPDGGPIEMSATTLDHYSRCSFQALAYDRWKLNDLREPDVELWTDSRGNILHQAVKHLLQSKVSIDEALDRAWKEKPPRGLIRSPRVENYVRSRMKLILQSFLAEEREFQERAESRTIALDDRTFRLNFREDGITVIGTPDRIEENSSGVFIIDYKSSSALPTGTEMLEAGYRLQLPFYALAVGEELKKPVTGVQFIELTKKGARGKGMFFEPYNGKEKGKFTSLTKRSKSLLVSIESEQAWSQMRDYVLAHAKSYAAGRFEATPKFEKKECAQCRVADLCGYRRKNEESSEGGASE